MGPLFLVLTFLPLFFSFANPQESIQLVPALYVFGDSTVDGGNSNPLPPYGIDLNFTVPRHWSNGKTIADFIASLLGLPLVPPYNNSMLGKNSTTGVNFGFAGSGILPHTQPDQKWSFDNQINYFRLTIADNLSKILSPPELTNHIRKSIFLISFGINDYSLQYLPLNNGTIANLTSEVFAKYLLDSLSERLTTLHGMGARKFVVKNIWPMGCLPVYRRSLPCCNETINRLLLPYGNSLPSMLQNLASRLPGFVFSNSDDFEFLQDLELHTQQYGITNTTGPCWLFPNIELCPNRDSYLYFDEVHTTEAANHLFSRKCFSDTLCSPRNIIELVGS